MTLYYYKRFGIANCNKLYGFLSLRGLKRMERMKGLEMTCKLGDFQNVPVFQFASLWVVLCNNQVIKPCVIYPNA